IQPMLQTAHKLVGSLGTFGFQDASQIACSIEKLLISYSEIPATDTAECLSQIDGLIEDLQAELVDRDEQLGLPAIGTTADPAPAAPAFAGLAPANLASVAQPILLVIDGDRELTDSLLQEAIAWKMRVVVAATIEQGRAQIQQERPAAVLLDPTLPGIPEALLAELAAADDPIPVLIFSLKDRSIERVNALRLGGQLFLPKSATPGQIFRAVTEVLQPPEPLHAKVLAVDDDPQILLSLRALLEPEGIQLTCLSDSTQFWETLRSVQPDLVIFDLRMPQISGLDLCQSVRHDFQWNWLPVIFLTTSSDRETIQQVFRAGADDYVTKPIVPEELLLRVLNRLKRSRLLRDRAEIDELTGVANRQHSTKTLTQLIQFATDFQQPFCLAILDLDHFKQINDRYGHAQGDRILHQFGQFLQQKFRSGDLVARWGGEEFVVGMYGISSEDSIDRLANMLEEWQAQTITSLTGELLKVSFSAGLAQFPADGTALQVLYRAADAALYRAKRGGRSRIVASHWQSTRSPATPGKVAEVPIRASVAVVHPNLEFAQSLRRSFEIRGYSMQWLQSGEAAIEHLQNPTFSLPGVPTLMLLAEQTTDWDGLTVLRQLKAEVKNRMQIILLLDQSALLEEAQALSVADVLLMPCSVTVILQRLRQLIR
ncbi:diguanylate cyclase, partial [Leptolyngbya sp. FACHB-711]